MKGPILAVEIRTGGTNGRARVRDDEGSTAMGERRQDNHDADVEFTKVTISMPRWMHDDLRKRARRRGISVTELMRRAVALDAVVFDPAHPTREIVLRDGDGSPDRILQPL